MAELKLRTVLLLTASSFTLASIGCVSQEPFRLNTAFGKKSRSSEDVANAIKKASAKGSSDGNNYSIDTSKRTKDFVKQIENANQRNRNTLTHRVKSAASATASYVTEPFLQTPGNAAINNDPTRLANRPNNISADLFVKSAAHLETVGNIPAAFEQYKKALQVDANDKAALVGLGRLQHRQKQMDDAISTYQNALAIYPNDSVILNDLGLCYARMQRFDQAIDTLQKAVAAKPDSSLYQNNLAATFVEAGRPDEAVAALSQVHGAAIANYNVGYLLHQRQSAAATQYFSNALSIDPNMNAAKTMMAKIQPSHPPMQQYRNQVNPRMPMERAPSNMRPEPEYLHARRPRENDLGQSLPPIVLPHQVTPEMQNGIAPFNYQDAAKTFARSPDVQASQDPSHPSPGIVQQAAPGQMQVPTASMTPSGSPIQVASPQLLPPTTEADPMQQVLNSIEPVRSISNDVFVDNNIAAAGYTEPSSTQVPVDTETEPAIRMPSSTLQGTGHLVPPTPVDLSY